MTNDIETVEQVCEEFNTPKYTCKNCDFKICPSINAFSERVLAAHKREEEAWKQSVTDCNRLGNAAIDIQKNTVAKLCELLKEFADVLNDTKSYMCFCCTIRGCPGEHECRYTKKYCLLVDKTMKAIEDAK